MMLTSAEKRKPRLIREITIISYLALRCARPMASYRQKSAVTAL